MIRSLYLHVPFCAKICHYCDFAKTANFNSQLVDRYFIALYQDLKTWCEQLSPKLQTLYIGGGTPSLFSNHYQPLFNFLAPYLDNNCEITLECNPDDLVPERLSSWQQLGINRLSIGVQSFNNKYLKFLHRTHQPKQTIDNIFVARKFFSNISIDLIYGMPQQTTAEVIDELTVACSLPIDHLSYYNLTYEQQTPIGRAQQRGKLQALDENIEADIYHLICCQLKNNEFDHYEISNWAKKDRHSRHNQAYWQDEGYLAIGNGAHGYLPTADNEGIRYYYDRNERKFTNSKATSPIAKQLTVKQLLNCLNVNIDKGRDRNSWLLEYLSTSLRTSRGVDLKLIKQKTNKTIAIKGNLRQAIIDKTMAIEDDFLKLSNKEWFRENYWLERIDALPC